MRIQEKIKYYTKLYRIESLIVGEFLMIELLITSILLLFEHTKPTLFEVSLKILINPPIAIIFGLLTIIAILDMEFTEFSGFTIWKLKQREFDAKFTMMSMYKQTKHAYENYQTIPQIQLTNSANLNQQEYENILNNQKAVKKSQKNKNDLKYQYKVAKLIYENANSDFKA